MKNNITIALENLTIGLLLLTAPMLQAQDLYQWEDTIRYTSEQIMMSEEWTARAASLDRMPTLLSQALDAEGSFDITFDSSRIAITYAPDSSFRLLTGQAVLDGEAIKYYGVLQQKADERNPIILHDQSYAPSEITGEVLTPENWNGALYYNVIKTRVDGNDFYIAFGFAAKTFFENSKVAEIIYFEDGKVKFGAPIFTTDDGKAMHRLSLIYAADVGARLNYDSTLAMIVFDNLIPMKSPYKERKVMMVPDGSYSGYAWEENKGWVFVDKIFHQTLDEAPREVPVLDMQKGKDINGRAIKEKKQ
ncbi:MAG: hypothetical protein HKN76_11020 [Saprospiraceae bacterium]|nr:hypothetical protein [Saprospiraceae bacterium]